MLPFRTRGGGRTAGPSHEQRRVETSVSNCLLTPRAHRTPWLSSTPSWPSVRPPLSAPATSRCHRLVWLYPLPLPSRVCCVAPEALISLSPNTRISSYDIPRPRLPVFLIINHHQSSMPSPLSALDAVLLRPRYAHTSRSPLRSLRLRIFSSCCFCISPSQLIVVRRQGARLRADAPPPRSH